MEDKKVYNEAKTAILTNYDLNEGYLREDTIIKHIEGTSEIKEVYHLEPILGYKNCFRKVVDVKGVKATLEQDVEEKIFVYIPYTEIEKVKIQNNKKIIKLKKWFDKDYRYYCEKLTRFQALGLTEEIEDMERGTSYHSLTELYEEAEKVRSEINDLEL